MTDFPFRGKGLLGGNPYLFKVPRLNIYEDANKKWRWQVFMSSDEVGASTQGYANKSECIDNLKKIANHILELERTGKLV